MEESGSSQPCSPTKKPKKPKLENLCDLSSDDDDDDDLLVSIWDSKPSDKQTNLSQSASVTDDCRSRPSCSGLNTDNSLESPSLTPRASNGVTKLKAMFPLFEEDILKSYLEVYDMEECIQVMSNFMYGGEDDPGDCSMVSSKGVQFSDSKQTENTLSSKKQTSSAYSSLLACDVSTISSPVQSICSNKGKNPKSPETSTSVHPSTVTSLSHASNLTENSVASYPIPSNKLPCIDTKGSAKSSSINLSADHQSSIPTCNNSITKTGIVSAIKCALGFCSFNAASPHTCVNCEEGKSPISKGSSSISSTSSQSQVMDVIGWGNLTIPSKELTSSPSQDVQHIKPKQTGNAASFVKKETVLLDEETRNKRLHYYSKNDKKKNQANGTPRKVSTLTGSGNGTPRKVSTLTGSGHGTPRKVSTLTGSGNGTPRKISTLTGSGNVTPRKVSTPTGSGNGKPRNVSTPTRSGNGTPRNVSTPTGSGNGTPRMVSTPTGSRNVDTESKSPAASIHVGIDIRCGNKKTHPSMKRCFDRSAARKDIAKPYKRDANGVPVLSTCDSRKISTKSHENQSNKSSQAATLSSQVNHAPSLSSTACSSNILSKTPLVPVSARLSSNTTTSSSSVPKQSATNKVVSPLQCSKDKASSVNRVLPPSTSQASNSVGIACHNSKDKTPAPQTSASLNSSAVPPNVPTPSSTTIQYPLSQLPSPHQYGKDKGKTPMRNSSSGKSTFSSSTSSSSQSHVAVDWGNLAIPASTVSKQNEKQVNSSEFLSDFTQGIKDMNCELESMLKKVISRNDHLSDLCQGHSSHSQSKSKMVVTPEDEKAEKEMLSLQNETEILSKLFPELDPNYIFYKLETVKDDPGRVTKVNEQLMRKRKEGGKSGDSTKKSVLWSWEGHQPGKFLPFTDTESNYIELQLKKSTGRVMNIQFKGSNRMLGIDFQAMRMTDYVSNRNVRLQRADNIHGTPSKSSESGSQLQGPAQKPRSLIEVFPGTSEFARVESLLKKSIQQAYITTIERIDNSWLQQKYYMQYDLLKQKNGEVNVNVKELFHGTRGTAPNMIWDSEDGFDMRYSAEGMWGRGCYFAVHAAYSHVYSFQKHKHNGICYQMFLAHVLTGDSASLEPGAIIKPPFNERTRRDYDSITGITKGHQIYVLYNNAMSYPAYLITYTM